HFVWYSDKEPSQCSKQGISGEPGFNKLSRNWNSFDLVGCNSSLRTRADTNDFRVRLVTTKMVEHGSKSTFIAEIFGIKVPKKINSLALPIASFHYRFLSDTRSPQCPTVSYGKPA